LTIYFPPSLKTEEPVSASEESRLGEPVVARGNNMVFLAPPSPAWAAPVLYGIGTGLEQGGRALLLAPRESLDAWAAQVSRQLGGGDLHWHAARGEARAMRLLRAEQLQLLLVTPESALALVRRSALKLDTITCTALLWPERLPDDVLELLLQDLPKDSQRVIVSSRSDVALALAERYARKAVTAGPLAGAAPVSASGPIRVAATPWGSRAQAAAHVIELLDPQEPVVFAADRSAEPELRRAVAHGVAPLVTETPASAGLIIAWDPPTPEQYAQLKAVAEVVMLAPPGTESWASRLGSMVRPLRLPGFVDDAMARGAATRAEIQRALEGRSLDAEAMTLAPLFERYDATEVAAALLALWSATRAVPEAAGTVSTQLEPATARIWVSVGQRDQATPGDLMAALVKELGVDRSQIGKIEMRESFSLVQLPATDAERIAERLTGVMIRRRKVAARLDRGRRA
jgi:ATP-dependent RNA helicase DeaD